MYVENDLIEAVNLDREQVPVPGYVGNIKRHLKEKYKGLLQEAQSAAEFLVVPQNRASSNWAPIVKPSCRLRSYCYTAVAIKPLV